MGHYHIRWSDKATLDWQCFVTYSEAEASAKELLLQNETYTIEEFDDTCPRCRAATTERGLSKSAAA